MTQDGIWPLPLLLLLQIPDVMHVLQSTVGKMGASTNQTLIEELRSSEPQPNFGYSFLLGPVIVAILSKAINTEVNKREKKK